MRHSLTAKALEELLMLLSAMLPADAKLPKTVHQLKKIFLGKDVANMIQKAIIIYSHAIVTNDLACL